MELLKKNMGGRLYGQGRLIGIYGTLFNIKLPFFEFNTRVLNSACGPFVVNALYQL